MTDGPGHPVPLARKLAAEFFGTFCLVLVGTGAIVVNDVSGGGVTPVGIALCFGLVVLAMFTILNVSARVSVQPQGGPLLVAAAVAAVIAMSALWAGPVCGASLNPARSLAPALLTGTYNSLWLYLVAPVCGALVGVGVWRAVRG